MTSEWHGSMENCLLFFRYAAVLNKLPKFWDKNEKDFSYVLFREATDSYVLISKAWALVHSSPSFLNFGTS